MPCCLLDSIQDDLLQHRFPDIMDGTAAPVFLIGRAAVELLIGLDALGCAEIQLGTTVSAVDQTGEQAGSAGSRIPAAVTAQLLHTLKGVDINDRLLCIRDDLPFILGMLHLFLYLEADKDIIEFKEAYGICKFKMTL